MILHTYVGESELRTRCTRRAKRETIDLQALANRLERSKVIRQTLLALGVFV